MNETKLTAVIICGFFAVCAGVIAANAYNTKKTNEIIKYAIDHGANITLSKNGSK